MILLDLADFEDEENKFLDLDLEKIEENENKNKRILQNNHGDIPSTIINLEGLMKIFENSTYQLNSYDYYRDLNYSLNWMPNNLSDLYVDGMTSTSCKFCGGLSMVNIGP